MKRVLIAIMVIALTWEVYSVAAMTTEQQITVKYRHAVLNYKDAIPVSELDKWGVQGWEVISSSRSSLEGTYGAHHYFTVILRKAY